MMKKERLALAPVAVLLLAGSALGQEFVGVLMPGMGMDSATQTTKKRCIDWPPVHPPEDLAIAAKWRMERVESTRELKSLLEANASLKVSALFGSVSAKTSLSQEASSFEHNLYYLLSGNVETGFVGPSSNPTFGSDVPRFWESRNYIIYNPRAEKEREFRRACGDAYISSVKFGGSIHALIEVRTSSARQKRSMSASLDARVGVVKLDANFAKTMEANTAGARVTISFARVGGKLGRQGHTLDELKNTRSFADFYAQVQGFEETLAAGLAVVDIRLSPYSVATPKAVFSSTPDNEGFVSRADELHLLLLEERGELQQLLEYPSRFKPFPREEAEEALGRTVTSLKELRRQAKRCESDETCDVAGLENLWPAHEFQRPEVDEAVEAVTAVLLDVPTATTPFLLSKLHGCAYRGNFQVSGIEVSRTREGVVRATYQCQISGGQSDCGGGWSNRPETNQTYPATVLAPVALENGLLSVGSVRHDFNPAQISLRFECKTGRGLEAAPVAAVRSLHKRSVSDFLD